jgi:hypothetical protein
MQRMCKMSHSRSIQYKLILLGFYGGVATIVVQPAIAQDLTAKETNTSQVTNQVNVTSIAASTAVSTKANDLLLPAIKQPKYFIDVQQATYQARQIDLAKFCQNYPYNSKCQGANSSLETKPNDVSIPDSSDNSQNSKEPKSGWAIVPEISTLGLGGHVVREITPKFNARVGVNTFGQDININETEYEYKGNLNLFNVSTLLDVQPFKKSGFKLSAGLIFGNNNIQGTADVSERVANELGEVKIQGQTIDIRDLNIQDLASIDTDIEINEGLSPYLGIGGGNAVKAGKGLGFWWDLGVVFSGSPEAEVTSNFSTEIPAELRDEVVAAADEALKDEEKDLNEALDIMGIYPVLSLGLSYQF